MASTQRSRFFQLLLPFAGPLAVLSVAVAGVALPFVVASTVGDNEPLVFAPLPPLDVAKVIHGREVYSTTCFACHAADAKGVANLGKDLTSGFSRDTNDADLIAMIMRGRQPGEPKHTAAVPMPPKGGREDLTRSDVADVVAYLRGLQDPSRLTQPLPEPAVATVSAEPVPEPKPTQAVATPPATVVVDTAAPTSVAFNPEAALRGKKVYNSCIACHGKTGAGVANLGADLVHSPFIASKTDEELVAFIKKGRMPTDADTRLRLTMPPKGGNPALNDKQIADVVSYLRSLQATQSASR